MIPDDLRRELVAALMRMPLVDGETGPAGRNALLAGMPLPHLNRSPGNAYADILLLVDQLSGIFGPNGEWRLLQFVDNALPAVDGTELGGRLRQIRAELHEFERAVHVRPAEIAQVHLFDLRLLVNICSGSLLGPATASGWVITTPTPRLLAYFCDSLKQRGAGDGVWGRQEVATPGPPLVIDPRHTTVAFAAARAEKVRSLLTRKHVLWPIYVAEAADAEDLWLKLRGAFEEPLEHHLVIAFGMPTGTNVPAGMTPLPAPRFTSQDVMNWLNPIGKTLTWRQTRIEWWAQLILTGCAGSPDDLPIEMVYEQLERHRGLITQHRDPADLMVALEDLASWSLLRGLPWTTLAVRRATPGRSRTCRRSGRSRTST